MSGTSASAKQAALEQILVPARIVPVLTIDRAEDGVPLARALVAGGVKVLEVTFRTEAASAAAKAIIAEVPDAIVGMGTVLNGDDLRRARDLGARFAVSPGATFELLDAASASDLPLLPGIATSSEIMQAQARGFNLLKFFPAEQAGGISMLRALSGPFPATRFCPTGGINADNVATWLAEPNVVCAGGSWLCPASDIKAANWEVITGRCIDAMKRLRRR
ncbi:bifunctional 4-hydroxy-2-oxoglutarate aldolase/2-dehydro-3-deoxy-phosphogluconate aldolase [Bradyrhizobium sp. G127]|uniref:bifunctional 4-hydroxy-2-oxoglutarate aldolase/2-dehydro-3-deoxy-phosphogluconate aldolase n=1 Tax=Bradyrhizobium sp. G127 TaxID=2904800 RepID=UPI001F46D4BA|nr:bifunctional 4-hydroxy-2-oxoglutarate aldolase/2-dehydro-3-deoxy-phosphogluconate aldolase [Bradyrhizobium sp. G127]MCF2522922.1 bifunctional 4-hydroxy-2-oxoglutarate aldolase/2-dehydro-3-deoxy-phosphogluconate aldolase [Bradyrhizobium sp. G127]